MGLKYFKYYLDNFLELYHLIFTVCYLAAGSAFQPVNPRYVNFYTDITHGWKGKLINRRRRHVAYIFYELGLLAQRYYRMDKDSFNNLDDLLGPKLNHAQRLRKSKRGKTPNGDIPNSLYVSAALQYFAGGCPIDIALVHGMSHSQVFKCIWLVVDAVNMTVELDIKFPSNHARQQKIAREFHAKSHANFPNCIGCIDGILIWIHKPDKEQCDLCQIGPENFYAGESTSLI